MAFEWYKKFRQKWLVKKSKFVWRKKTHPEHKYSVTFVSKVGTKTVQEMISDIIPCNFEIKIWIKFKLYKNN